MLQQGVDRDEILKIQSCTQEFCEDIFVQEFCFLHSGNEKARNDHHNDEDNLLAKSDNEKKNASASSNDSKCFL